MTAHRATILAAGAATLMLAGAPAAAQADRSAVLNILVECAKIDDPSARLACYDNNIRAAGGQARAAVPGQFQAPTGGGAPVASANSPQGFGREDLRTPERFTGPAGQLHEISTKITAIRAREPGIYALTLEDGAQWVFAEGVSSAYRLPHVGAVIEIERGALGSFLMRFDGQGPVPVRRIK